MSSKSPNQFSTPPHSCNNLVEGSTINSHILSCRLAIPGYRFKRRAIRDIRQQEAELGPKGLLELRNFPGSQSATWQSGQVVVAPTAQGDQCGSDVAAPATIADMTDDPDHNAHAQAVDLFAGPGGLDVGASWLGLSVVGVEIDPNACATRAAAGLATVQGDVRKFGPKDFPSASILTGGPPCQTFTLAGTGSGRKALEKVLSLVEDMARDRDITSSLGELEDERTGLVLQPLRWALDALADERPYEAVVLEQVPSVLPVWQAVGDVLAQHGYHIDHGILRTEQYGVPQTRRRAILVARYRDDVELPAPTHEKYRKGGPRQGSIGMLPWVPMGEALDRDREFTVISNYGSGGDPKNRGQRTSQEPAATVTGKVTRNRLRYTNGEWDRLTLPEAGRLQTFPLDFPWSGNAIGQQIGNAIPPRLAVQVLAAATKQSVDGPALDEVIGMPWSTSRLGMAHHVASGQLSARLTESTLT